MAKHPARKLAYSLFGSEHIKRLYHGWSVVDSGVVWLAWFLPVFWVLFERKLPPSPSPSVGGFRFTIGPVRERSTQGKL